MNSEYRGACATILIVEDLDWIRSGMRRLLHGYGYRVLEATNDEEAIEVAERTRPDLILTDEELPTFFRFADRLRRHPTLRTVPVVVVNPDAEEGSRFGDAVVLTGFDRLESLLGGVGFAPEPLQYTVPTQ